MFRALIPYVPASTRAALLELGYRCRVNDATLWPGRALEEEIAWYADYLRWVSDEVANKVVVAPAELQGELIERAVDHLCASRAFNSHELSAIVRMAKKRLEKMEADTVFSRQAWATSDGALEEERKVLKERLATLLAREGIQYDE